MKKIKVALVITRMDWGGSSDIIRSIALRLDPRLYDVRIIAGLTRFPSAKTKAFFAVFKDKITTLPLLRREINLFFDVAAFCGLYRIFRREKFDIVHTHTAKAGVLGRLAAAAAGVPVVIHTPHGHNFYGYFGPVFSKIIIGIERFAGMFTSAVTTFTALEKSDLIRFRVIRPEKISLIYPGLEPDAEAAGPPDAAKVKNSLGMRPEERCVGMIGRLEPIKGPGYFIEAAAKIAGGLSNVKFVVVGEGSMRSQLEGRAQAFGIREKFIFTGWREDAKEIMSVLDILVLPSLNEAVGMVLIEAQSQGIPVIASSVGGIPEVVKDRQTGLLVSPAAPGELADAIRKLLEDEGMRERMGHEARDWVRGRFMAETMAAAFSGLYANMLALR